MFIPASHMFGILDTDWSDARLWKFYYVIVFNVQLVTMLIVLFCNGFFFLTKAIRKYICKILKC